MAGVKRCCLLAWRVLFVKGVVFAFAGVPSVARKRGGGWGGQVGTCMSGRRSFLCY